MIWLFLCVLICVFDGLVVWVCVVVVWWLDKCLVGVVFVGWWLGCGMVVFVD